MASQLSRGCPHQPQRGFAARQAHSSPASVDPPAPATPLPYTDGAARLTWLTALTTKGGGGLELGGASGGRYPSTIWPAGGGAACTAGTCLKDVTATSRGGRGAAMQLPVDRPRARRAPALLSRTRPCTSPG